MKCKNCSAESGEYPLCKDCYAKANQFEGLSNGKGRYTEGMIKGRIAEALNQKKSIPFMVW